MAEFNINQTKLPTGVKDLGETNLQCAGCNKIIAHILKVRDDELSLKFKAKCPCGDESFIVTVDGQIMIRAAEGYELVDIASENYITILTIIKEK